MRTIEFQKRGVPHYHILPFLDRNFKFDTPEKIDRVVCAEIPDPDEESKLHAIIAKFMMHGFYDDLNPEAPYMKMDKCTGKMKCCKGFPKTFQSETEIHEDGYPLYRRRDDGRQVVKYVKRRGIVYLDNRWIAYFSLTYEAHSSDRAIVELSADNNQIYEVKQYLNAHYVGPCEAIWRILSFDLHEESPSVLALQIHLPNHQFIVFNTDTSSFDLLEHAPSIKIILMTFFDYNSRHTDGRGYIYIMFTTSNPNHGRPVNEDFRSAG